MERKIDEKNELYKKTSRNAIILSSFFPPSFWLHLDFFRLICWEYSLKRKQRDSSFTQRNNCIVRKHMDLSRSKSNSRHENECNAHYEWN